MRPSGSKWALIWTIPQGLAFVFPSMGNHMALASIGNGFAVFRFAPALRVTMPTSTICMMA